MNYKLQIQKNLQRIEHARLSFSEEKALMKECVALAEENDDVAWACDLRYDLMFDVLSNEVEMMQEGAKLLAAQAAHPDIIKEDENFLWHYRAAWFESFFCPEIPFESILSVGEDYRQRLERNNFGLRSYYATLGHFYYETGENEKLADVAEKMMQQPVDSMSAPPFEKLIYRRMLQRTGRKEEAINLAKELASDPTKHADPIWERNRNLNWLGVEAAWHSDFDTARHYLAQSEELRELYPTLLKRRGFGTCRQILLRFLVQDEKRWDDWDSLLGEDVLECNSSTLFLAECLAVALQKETTSEVQLNLPRTWSCYSESGLYKVKELQQFFYEMALERAAPFDKRSGNTFKTDRIRRGENPLS